MCFLRMNHSPIMGTIIICCKSNNGLLEVGDPIASYVMGFSKSLTL